MIAAAPRPSLVRSIAGALGAVLVMAVVTSCLIGRKSSEFECSTDDDCDGARICDQGYCVEAKCPSICDSCDPVLKTCDIRCGQGDRCGSSGSLCPGGYACTISCSGTNACIDSTVCPATARSCSVTCSTMNACGDLQCAAGVQCTFNCNDDSACGNIKCGAGAKCNVMCMGMNACGTVDCATACACDVDCDSGECGIMSCSGGAACKSPTTGECSSTLATGCSTCPL